LYNYQEIYNSDFLSNNVFTTYGYYSTEDNSEGSGSATGWGDFWNTYYEYYIRRTSASSTTLGQGSNSTTYTDAAHIPDGNCFMGFYTWDSSQESTLTVDWAQVKDISSLASNWTYQKLLTKNSTTGHSVGEKQTAWSDFRDTYYIYSISRDAVSSSITYTQGSNSATFTKVGIPTGNLFLRLNTWNGSLSPILTVDWVKVELVATDATTATVASLNTKPLDYLSKWNGVTVTGIKWNGVSSSNLFSIGGF
jgi:hypothetical protein